MFYWPRDAHETGGQSGSIQPFLDRAQLAVFPINRRIGDGTWAEITRCREQKKPAFVYFADQSRVTLDWNSEEQVAGWQSRLRKRKELTENWLDPASDSITPRKDYKTIDELKAFFLQDLKRHLARSVFGPKPGGATEPSRSPEQWDSALVRQYREQLREEVAVRTRDLDDKEFLIARSCFQSGGGSLPLVNYSSVVRRTHFPLVHLCASRDISATTKLAIAKVHFQSKGLCSNSWNAAMKCLKNM